MAKHPAPSATQAEAAKSARAVILQADFEEWRTGKVLPGRRLRIVGTNLKPMPIEHLGEIQLPECEGWWGAPPPEAMTADGWLRTGDLGRFDPATVTPTSWFGVVYLIIVGSLVGYSTYSWLLGVAPMAWILRSKAQHVLALCIFGLWFGMELNEPASPLYFGGDVRRTVGPVDGLLRMSLGKIQFAADMSRVGAGGGIAAAQGVRHGCIADGTEERVIAYALKLAVPG